MGYEKGPGVWLGMVSKDKVSLYSPGTYYVYQVGLELTDIQACLCFLGAEVKGLMEPTAPGTVLEQGTCLSVKRTSMASGGYLPPYLSFSPPIVYFNPKHKKHIFPEVDGVDKELFLYHLGRTFFPQTRQER